MSEPMADLSDSQRQRLWETARCPSMSFLIARGSTDADCEALVHLGLMRRKSRLQRTFPGYEVTSEGFFVAFQDTSDRRRNPGMD